MGTIDETLKANERFYQSFTQGLLPTQPARRLAVLTCMDSRIQIEDLLGLAPGDAHMLRNAGAIVTDDVMRSLLVSHHILQTQEFMIIGHTDCGLQMIREDELRNRLRRQFGAAAVTPSHFHAFHDVEESVREQVQRVKCHTWMPKSLPVRGFVYDVRTGRLEEVNS